MKTLAEYLASNPGPDHILRAGVRADGTATFYIHPMDQDGDTLDFYVSGNTLTPLQDAEGNVVTPEAALAL